MSADGESGTAKSQADGKSKAGMCFWKQSLCFPSLILNCHIKHTIKDVVSVSRKCMNE